MFGSDVGMLAVEMNADGGDQQQVCSECGRANVRLDTVRSAFWHDDRLVVVEDIPALICDGCGEQFYDDATVMLLDMLKGLDFPAEIVRKEVVVPVFSLRDSSGWSGGR